METVQIVIEKPLLREADHAARRLKMNRSALFRAALREHLRRIRTRERERLDREGYERVPEDAAETGIRDKVCWSSPATPPSAIARG